MNLPTCPREDCTASDRHYHLVRTGGAMPCPDCYTPRPPQPAAVVLPTVDEVADVLRSNDDRFHTDAARAVLDLIAARLPAWQPVEPGTVIKAGTVTRIEWDDRDAREAVTRADYTPCQTDPARFYLDPRTVPAEPEPLVALVLQRAQDCGEAGELTRDEARDLLARIDAARGAL